MRLVLTATGNRIFYGCSIGFCVLDESIALVVEC